MGGENGLKSRIVDVVDEEQKRLQSAVTGLVMDNGTVAGTDPAVGGREAFSTVEVEEMSQTCSKPFSTSANSTTRTGS